MEGGKSSKMRRRPFFVFWVFFFFFFFFLLFTFQNGENSSKMRWGEALFFFFFFFAFHFSKQLKFVLGVPKWKFSTGKNAFHAGKKSGKMTLPPQKNFPVTPLSWWRYFFPYPFLDLWFFCYFFFILYFFHFENLSKFIIFLNEVVRGIEPQTNNYEPNY